MDEQKKLLLKILEITGTENDKKTFVDMFSNLLFEETVYALIQSLPNNRRESVGKKWDANVDNHAALTSLLKHNFTEKQIEKASEQTAEKAIREYLQSIDDKLNDNQREQLRKLAENI